MGPLPEDHARILAQKLADGQLALLVGAGLSRQAVAKDGSGRKLPLWKGLAEQVAAACHEDLDTYNGNVLDLFDAIVYGQSRFELEEAVRRVLDDDGFAPSAAHDALAPLPWAGVYTTNYDGLLAHALKETPVAEEDQYDWLQRTGERRPRLFHVHGTLQKPHTLTRDDYRLWPEKHGRAYRDIEQLLLNKTVLFVGYSLSDPHLADGLLPLVRELTKGREKRLYAWMWQIPPNQAQLLDRRDKIEVVSIDRDEDWAAAFRQLAGWFRAEPGKAAPLPALDPYAYDRQQYLAAMQVRSGFANLQGLYVGGAGYARTDVSLEEVFVEPDLEVTPTAASAGDSGELADALSLRGAMRQRAKDGEVERDGQQAGRREPAMRVLAREAKLLIVGSPGEGKSTLLRRALLQAVALWREQPSAQPFPVLVKLSDWEAEDGPCEGRLTGYVESRLPKMGEIGSQAVKAWLGGPVLWLLDGIDEIRDPGERARLTQEVQAASARWPQHRWVIATRPAGEPRGGLGAGWSRAVLPCLSDPQVEDVLARWGRVLETKEGLKLDVRQVAGDLRRDAGLRQVRGNALLLTLAILFFKTRKRLPHDRWEFYAAADASLRDTWVAHRILKAERYLPGDWLPELLDRLALDGMVEGRVLFDASTLKDAAKSVLAARGYTGGEQDREADRFLAAAEDLIGVLVAQAPDRFGFLHLTFQEFYAARAVARKGEEERSWLIAQLWDHPDWREVWPLYALAVQNEPAKYEHLFATILASGCELNDHLFRPQFACLRLAGVGSAPLPPGLDPARAWALDVLKGDDWPLFHLLWVARSWERWAGDLRTAVLARLIDNGATVRWAVVMALAGAAGEAEVRAPVIARLADDFTVVRSAAVEALAGSVGEADVRVAVLAGLIDVERNVREAAVRAVTGYLGDAEVCAAVLARLTDDELIVRKAAVQAVAGALGEVEVRSAVLARLADPDGSVRAAAVQVLAGALGEAALLARLADADGSVRVATVQALAGSLSDADVRAAVVMRLTDHDRNVREAAVQALAGLLGDAEVRAAVLARLADDDEWVRRAAVQMLAGAVGEVEVRSAVLARLADVAEWVRSAAVEALAGAAGEAEVRAAVLARLEDGDEWVRNAAVQALAEAAGEAEVRAAVLVRLADDDAWVRRAAVVALAGAVGEAAIRAAVLARLADDDGFVRKAAVQALAGAVDEAAVRAVVLRRLADDDMLVRFAAGDTLAAWVAAEKFGLPSADVVPVYP